MKNKNLLMILIWPLYNVSKIDDVIFDKNLSDYIKRGYSLKKRNELYKNLVWANENPNYNFLEIMNNAPSVRKVEFANSQVYKHLMSFKKFMENEEFGLLTDDKPTSFLQEKWIENYKKK